MGGRMAGISSLQELVVGGSATMMFCNSEEQQKVLICEFCGKEFRGRNLRQRRDYHLLTHSGLRPHICPHCPHRTALKSNLIKHIRAIHRSQYPYPGN